MYDLALFSGRLRYARETPKPAMYNSPITFGGSGFESRSIICSLTLNSSLPTVILLLVSNAVLQLMVVSVGPYTLNMWASVFLLKSSYNLLGKGSPAIA